MKIGPLRQRVTFQERQVVTDDLGNQSSQWTDLFSRWCEVIPVSTSESEGNSTTQVKEQLRLICRDESSIRALDSRQIRLVFQGQSYQVTGIVASYDLKGLVMIDVTREVSYDQD